MGVPYARGRKAFGFCDNCGLRWDLDKLKYQIYNLRNTHQKHCPDCLDEDHPQLQLGRMPVNDPQALFDPRPDINILDGRQLFSWNPVASNLPFMAVGIGQIKGVIS